MLRGNRAASRLLELHWRNTSRGMEKCDNVGEKFIFLPAIVE